MFKILIIDDEKPVITAISSLINWEHFELHYPPYTATDGLDALQQMKSVKPDIVFVDMKMPIMNGTEFLKRAAIDFPETQYIVVSGFDDFKFAQTAIQNGAIDYILKPIDRSDLNKSLEKAVKILTDRDIADPIGIVTSLGYEGERTINPKKAIQLVKTYVEQNYCAEIRIKEFSEKYFISKEYLSKLFKESYGMGIYEFALSLKMRKAKDLLSDSRYQIQEISSILGYSNNNYFSKAFRTYFGISPTEYRKDLGS